MPSMPSRMLKNQLVMSCGVAVHCRPLASILPIGTDNRPQTDRISSDFSPTLGCAFWLRLPDTRGANYPQATLSRKDPEAAPVAIHCLAVRLDSGAQTETGARGRAFPVQTFR